MISEQVAALEPNEWIQYHIGEYRLALAHASLPLLSHWRRTDDETARLRRALRYLLAMRQALTL